MTAYVSHRLLCLVTLGLLAAGPLAPRCAAAEPGTQEEVLDLEQAAALLRVGPDAVADMARAQRLPARRVGDSWRFSRAALLQWLQAGELLTLRGRGPTPQDAMQLAQATPEPRPAVSAAPLPTVGERPTAPTAEDVALRDQRVLLKRGVLTLDLGLSYSYSEQSLVDIVRQERRLLGASASIRYGLIDDLQATLRLPASSSRIKTFGAGTSGNPSTRSSASDSSFGDATLSLRGVALREAVGRPNMIWSLDAVLPSGPGDRGFGGGLVVSKSYDPAVIFAGLSYLRGLSLDPTDSRRSLPKHNVGLSMGYTYAVNEALALSSVLAGSYRSTTTPDDGSFAGPSERYQLQLGLTWSLTRSLFMEPGVVMQLGGENPDVSVSLNLAYTF